jgi:hypothetical protein
MSLDLPDLGLVNSLKVAARTRQKRVRENVNYS